MASIREYHRPGSIEEAVALLTRSGVDSVVIGGGTVVNADPSTDPVEVVDLQALGLDGVMLDDGSVRIGATTRLQDLVDAAEVPQLIREAAQREGPNTIRNVATIGGTVAAADADSGLVAALLVHHASVEIIGSAGVVSLPLTDLLADRSQLAGSIISAIQCELGGQTGWAGTGRTPADTPIVAAYARHVDGSTSLALTGVAATPVLVDPGVVGAVAPPSDFRGSAEYRNALAVSLAARVIGSLEVAL